VPDQELYKKYNDLLARLNQAWRYGPQGLVPQIQMMMDHYKSEISERMIKQQQDMAERAAKGKGKDGKGYSGVIDIV
jgi:hypothetical protein